MVEAGGFDAALMDIHIRGERVFPLCEVLAAKGVPFVLTSGYADWTMPDKWDDRPRLQKPYTIDQMEEALAAPCSATKALRPAGRRTLTLVPTPIVLLTSSAPLCRSTICLTIARPRPVPPDSRLRAASTR